jgi:hypothetical protein
LDFILDNIFYNNNAFIFLQVYLNMQNQVDKREANFWINKKDNEDNIKYRILATIFSSVPAETKFNKRHNLDNKLCEILKNETNPIITDNFHFHHKYGTSKEIEWLLSAYFEYGSAIGLENHGPDFIYRITEKTIRVAGEIERLELLDNKDIIYLKSIGERFLLSN